VSVDEQDQFHKDMEKAHVRALWERPPHGNRPIEPSWQWRWRDLEPVVDQAAQAVSTADAERRVLSLANPYFGAERSGATRNLSAALQILLPGERARPHRHSMNAIRFVLQGSGAKTLVDGKPCPMAERDLILTPAWTWHEHVHEGTERMVWFDSLDSPLHAYLGTTDFEPGPVRELPTAVADAAFAAPGMLPATVRPDIHSYSPLFRYSWDGACSALESLPQEPDGTRLLRYVNPLNGLAVTALMDCYLLAISAGKRTASRRAGSNMVCVVAEGEGESKIGDKDIRWSRNDVFTIPRMNVYEHHSASADAKLFLVSDRQVLVRLGLLADDKVAQGDL
jgi:gentisate 1,2-dioxygenase